MSSRNPISALRNWLRCCSAIDALAQSRTTVVRCTSCASLASLTSCKKAALIVAVGWEPTFAIDARRAILGGNFALAAGARASALVGESEFGAGPDASGVFLRRSDEDSGLFISEVSIGVDWSYPGRYATLVLGAGWEDQYWSGMPLATRMGDNFDDPSELFANGFILSMGISH